MNGAHPWQGSGAEVVFVPSAYFVFCALDMVIAQRGCVGLFSKGYLKVGARPRRKGTSVRVLRGGQTTFPWEDRDFTSI
jgi:hypothetical protein